MSYIYNMERPKCTCPRCRFATVNSQPKRSAHENSELYDEEEGCLPQLYTAIEKKQTADCKNEVIDAEKTTDKIIEIIKTENKADQTIEVINTEKPVDQIIEVRNTEMPADLKIVDIKTLISIIDTEILSTEINSEPQPKKTTVHGGMESFIGPIPVGWSSDTPHLVSREDGYGLVHSGRSSVRLKDGARLSFTAVNTGAAGSTLSFFALGTGRQTGLNVKAYYTSPDGERECASLLIREGDLPQAKSGFGYYVLDIPQVPSENVNYRIEFSVSALRRQCVLLDDVAFL